MKKLLLLLSLLLATNAWGEVLNLTCTYKDIEWDEVISIKNYRIDYSNKEVVEIHEEKDDVVYEFKKPVGKWGEVYAEREFGEVIDRRREIEGIIFRFGNSYINGVISIRDTDGKLIGAWTNTKIFGRMDYPPLYLDGRSRRVAEFYIKDYGSVPETGAECTEID